MGKRMGNILSISIIVAIVAFVLGLTLGNNPQKIKVFLGAGVIFFFWGVTHAMTFSEGMQQAIFLFVLLFLSPFGFGASLNRRFNKSNTTNKAESETLD